MKTLYIQTNSPGELLCWVKPVCHYVADRWSGWQIVIVMTPCQYATGHEAALAVSFPAVVEVMAPSVFVNYLWRQLWRRKRAEGAVLYLGGDPWYSRWLGLVHSLPTIAYTEGKRSAFWGFSSVHTRTEIGDLMGARHVDVPTDKNSNNGPPVCVFLAGSRPIHYRALLPFFATVVQRLRKRLPKVRFVTHLSVFMTTQDRQALASELAVFDHVYDGDVVDTIRQARLVVTIPGSNTMDMAYLKVAMLMVLPLNDPKRIALDGLAGGLVRLPGVRSVIWRLLTRWLAWRQPLLALPNQLLGYRAVPERVGVMTEGALATEIWRLWQDDRQLQHIRDALATLVPEATVLDRLLDGVQAGVYK